MEPAYQKSMREWVPHANETGRKVCESFKNQIPIIFDCHLPKWHYRAIPSKRLIVHVI